MSVMAQGLIVENARAKREQVAATSIDIIKCFERVPHRVIQRVGLQLGFPLGPLRFVLMLYRGIRRLLCDKAVSSDLVASAGIVAGCAYAAFLLRAVMEQPIKITAMTHPTISIFVFLDDVDLLAAGAGPVAATTCASATRQLVQLLSNLVGMHVSQPKCQALASSAVARRTLLKELPAGFNLVSATKKARRRIYAIDQAHGNWLCCQG